MYDYNFVLLVGDKAAVLPGLRVGLRMNGGTPTEAKNGESHDHAQGYEWRKLA